MEYYLSLKGTRTCAVVWMNPANILSELAGLIRATLWLRWNEVPRCSGGISSKLRHYLLEERWLIRLRKLIKLRRLRKSTKPTRLRTLRNSQHLPLRWYEQKNLFWGDAFSLGRDVASMSRLPPILGWVTQAWAKSPMLLWVITYPHFCK